jgi:hypothetical protein
MVVFFTRLLEALAAWLERLLAGSPRPELVPVPVPVHRPRRRR